MHGDPDQANAKIARTSRVFKKAMPPVDSPPSSPEPPTPEPKRSASLWQVFEAVFWSFFGVRKGKAMARDAVTIKPLQVIVVGLILAALFVLSLLALVRFIVSQT
jgi:DUF2970 family protein